MVNKILGDRVTGVDREGMAVTKDEFYDNDFRDVERPVTEYPFQEIIKYSLQLLPESADQADTDFLLNFWYKNLDPILGPEIARVLSALDTNEVTAKILERLNQQDEVSEKLYLSLLYRLELGKVGISEQGLDYLGRRFDLGEANNPDYFAHRLTPSGQVGIFDEERKLQGLVQLEAGDFKGGDQERIAKEIVDITYEMLFTPHPEETEEEKGQRLATLEEFKAQYFDTYLGLFDEKSDLRFNNLELPEQGWVLQYLQGADERQKDRFFQFISQFGEDGFRAFRSMEFGEEMAGQVLQVAEKTDPQTARAIFEQYSRTVALTKQVVSFAEQNLNPEIFGKDEQQRMNVGLLRRGRDLIARYAENPPESREIEAELRDMVAEVQLLAESFRAAGKSGHQLELGDFNTNIEIRSGQELGGNEAIKSEIIRIFNLNWDNAESNKAYPYMLEDLEQALADPLQKFYLIMHGDELIGFQRFKAYKPGEVYAASNNVRKTAQGSGIGEIATSRILDWEAAQHRVVAHAYSGHDAITHYIAQNGFVAIALEQYKDSGDLDFVIVKDDRLEADYHYQGAAKEQIIADFSHRKEKGEAEIIQASTADKAGFYSAVTKRTHQGMVVTAFFHEPGNSQRAYIVFEPSQLKLPLEAAEPDELPLVA